jgi:hypothetical protein
MATGRIPVDTGLGCLVTCQLQASEAGGAFVTLDSMYLDLPNVTSGVLVLTGAFVPVAASDPVDLVVTCTCTGGGDISVHQPALSVIGVGTVHL